MGLQTGLPSEGKDSPNPGDNSNDRRHVDIGRKQAQGSGQAWMDIVGIVIKDTPCFRMSDSQLGDGKTAKDNGERTQGNNDVKSSF